MADNEAAHSIGQSILSEYTQNYSQKVSRHVNIRLAECTSQNQHGRPAIQDQQHLKTANQLAVFLGNHQEDQSLKE